MHINAHQSGVTGYRSALATLASQHQVNNFYSQNQNHHQTKWKLGLACMTGTDDWHGWQAWMTILDYNFIYWLLTDRRTDGWTLLDVKSLSRLKMWKKIVRFFLMEFSLSSAALTAVQCFVLTVASVVVL